MGQEDSLEEEMAAHSSTLALEIPWTEEPEGLQSMGSQRVGQDLAAKQQRRILIYTYDTRGGNKLEKISPGIVFFSD